MVSTSKALRAAARLGQPFGFCSDTPGFSVKMFDTLDHYTGTWAAAYVTDGSGVASTRFSNGIAGMLGLMYNHAV